MSTAVVSTDSEFGVATQQESNELAPSAAVEAARQEVQAAVILAKRFPRNEDQAYQRLMKSCQRPAFAADVTYSFPRGGTTITGPSIYLAREFARLWGNIRHGVDVIADDDEVRTIRAWAWDLESNTKVHHDVPFKKLIQRKRNGQTQWIEPDERDLRELTNKHAAIAKRNCLLELLPSDMVDDAVARANKTLIDSASKDPDEARKNLITAFGTINISVENLEAFLGHKVATCSPAELVELRSVYKSIRDGNTTWSEAAAAKTSKSDELAAKVGQGETPSAPASPPKAKAATVAKLRTVIKDQQLNEMQVQAALAKLNLTGDPLKQSEPDTLRLIDEIEFPAGS